MGENLESFEDETDFTVEYDEVNSLTRHNVRPLQGMTIQNDVLQGRDHCGSNMFENKSDSVLLRKNDGEIKFNCPVDNINLSITFEEDKSINDISNTKLQTCQLSSRKHSKSLH
ncbi:PREDICTED: uncharacterized protein LOC108779499 [Cyphomyrmex costatus]|uniref:uncharacterized protein LOC108779499 n=1 Tax=Cyphomyrmex costatus TaxID=456900 RepID=UPI0008522388|nr:PREDICTED: uncharacterized protein LOC108779499 [Cyphomyrmex costatus]